MEVNIRINQIKGLNRQARKFLKENLITTRNADVVGAYFIGYLNGMYRIGITLVRENGKWYHFSTNEEIQSINGKLSHFVIHE